MNNYLSSLSNFDNQCLSPRVGNFFGCFHTKLWFGSRPTSFCYSFQTQNAKRGWVDSDKLANESIKWLGPEWLVVVVCGLPTLELLSKVFCEYPVLDMFGLAQKQHDSTNAGFIKKCSCAWYGCLWQCFLVGCYGSNRNFQLVYNMNE